MSRRLALLAGLVVCHCRCTPAFRECAPIGESSGRSAPTRLSGTGLRDPSTGELAAGVLAFTPRYPLWSDGAAKRRWIALPEGTRIDTGDPDAWRFPVGTRLWKEFAQGDVVVETRYLEKTGDAADAWTTIAYVHDASGDAAATPDGAIDARGTHHDVPSATTCKGCHGGRESFVLGFSAIQLPWRAAEGEVGLEDLVARGLLSDPAEPPSDAPTIPGDAATVAALGYLHANCSHCHNQARPARTGPRCFDPESEIDFFLRVGELDRPASTATYRTAVGVVIRPGDVDASEVIVRATSRDPWWGMPALGTERVDEAGVDVLRRWIRDLRAD